MDSNETHDRRGLLAGLSRRDLLKGSAALAAAWAVPAWAAQPGTIRAYVGCYTPNGQGIHLFSEDPSTGALKQIKVFQSPAFPSPSTTNPSWLAFDPQKKYLYAANEISNFGGNSAGAVSAFAVDQATGDLTFLNTVGSQGPGPAHVSVHPSGKFVFVANYGGGNVAVFSVLPGGALGNVTAVQADVLACAPPCPVGPTKAQNAPPGSFAISGHDAPHAHMIQSDAAGHFVLVNDLGLDLTIVWEFDSVAGTLSNPRTVPSSPGAGPRHFAFHPNGLFLYSLNEEASTLAFMKYDPATGSLDPVREVSALPSGFVGTNFASEVAVSPSGRFVYAANRLHDTIAVFALDAKTGEPTLVGEESTRADYPRSFTIDPTGNFLYSCNQRGDSITAFRILSGGRKLTFSGQYTAMGTPAVMLFLPTV